MRWALLISIGVLLGGCMGARGDHDPQAGRGTNAALPGLMLAGNATWNGEAWIVTAEATNDGSVTYKVDTGCSSPFGLDANAEEGQPYQEVQCLAYTEPVPFRPGERLQREWTIDPEPLGWDGQTHFILSFMVADRSDRILVGLDPQD